MKSFRTLLFVLLIISIFACIAPAVYANSAEPPAVVILASNPPDDLSVSLIVDGRTIPAEVRGVAWERYFRFYYYDIGKPERYVFEVTTGGESFEISHKAPTNRYRTILTLDLSARTLTEDLRPFRTEWLIAARVTLTLLIEGVVFLLFGYRQRKSWIVFVIVNLITQGALNLWISSNGTSVISTYGLNFLLYVGEFFVFIVEMLAFPALLEEKNKRRAVLYALCANTASLLLGGVLISYLPV